MLKSLIRRLFGFTPATAQTAAKCGDLSTLRRMSLLNCNDLLRGENDQLNLTPLHWAAAQKHLEVVAFLLSDKVRCDPNILRNNDFTPLHAAAMNGNASVCQLLLASGALPNLQTKPQGYAPLHSAAFIGHIFTLEVLLASGADVRLLNYRNEMPADTALRQGHPDAAGMLTSGAQSGVQADRP